MVPRPGKWIAAAVAAFSLLSFAALFAQAETALFRIDGNPVEKAEFRRFVEIAFPEETEPSETRLRVLADSFINNRLLAARARAEGVDKLSAVRSRLETRLNRLWTNVYWSEVAEPSIRIEEKDIEAMAPPMEDAIDLQQLTVETREHADELRRLVLAGADFGKIVKAESVGLTAHNGGYVGNVTKSSPLYGRELLDELFRMRPGEYSAVSKTDTGYAVIKVIEKKPSSRMRQEWLERNRDRLLRIRRQEAWNRWKENLVRQHECIPDRDVIDAYLRARENNASLEPLLGKAAVTVDGVPFTLRDLADPSGLGVVHSEDTVEEIIHRRLEEYAIAREAARVGLREKHPDILLIGKLTGEYLLAREYVAFRGRGLSVTEKERREYYEANRKKFTAPRAYRFSLIETRSPARLRTIYDLLEKGVSFEEVANRWSDNRQSAEGRNGFVEENRVPRELVPATKLALGEYARTPIRIDPPKGGEGVWIVPKLKAVREERALPFQEIDRFSVEKSVMAKKRERLIREIVAGLRAESRIEFGPEFHRYASQGAGPSLAPGTIRESGPAR
ncbi:MAG: peptidyl-prolyl cis-trans isomerase [Deltaproteobacteria bacterium]|nr:peptidyl-prolyl cis-trans isomerase [Deltaproteobacteria bacterium]